MATATATPADAADQALFARLAQVTTHPLPTTTAADAHDRAFFAGVGAATPADDQDRALFGQLQRTAEPAQELGTLPARIEPPQDATVTAGAATAPAGPAPPPPQIDPATGHVVDPVTGRPMQRGRPVDAVPTGFDWKEFGRGVLGTAGRALTGELGARLAGSTEPNPHYEPQIDPATGHVIDPISNEPLVKGQPHDVQEAGVVGKGLELATPPLQWAQTYVTNPVARVAALAYNPLAAWIKSGYQEAGKEFEQDPARANVIAGFLRGTISEAGLKAAYQGFINPTIETTAAFSGPGIREMPLFGMKPGTPEDEAVRGILNFLADIPIGMLADLVTTKAALPRLGKALAALEDTKLAQRLMDVPLPLPKALGGPISYRHMRVAAQQERELAHMIGGGAGRGGQILREALQAKTNAAKDIAALRQSGLNTWRKTPDGRRVDQIDELIYHWIEAGLDDRSKFQSREQALAAARALTPDTALGDRAAAVVERNGAAYARIWRASGERLEAAGYLKPGTVEAMGDRYAAGMYHSTSHNPEDIAAWLEAAQAINHETNGQYGLSEQAIALGNQLLGRMGSGGGGVNAAKGRTVGTFAEREARGGEFQASPIFGKSISGSARIAERYEVLHEVAKSKIAQPGSETVPRPPRPKSEMSEGDRAWQQHLDEQKHGALGTKPREPQPAGPATPQAAGETTAPPEPRWTAADLDKAKAEVEQRAAEHEQALQDLQAATAARAAPKAAPTPGQPRPPAPPELDALRTARQGVQDAMKEVATAKKLAETAPTEVTEAALAEARERVKEARAGFDQAALQYRRAKLSPDSLQARYAAGAEGRITEAQGALDRAVEAHLQAVAGQDAAAIKDAERAVAKASAGLKAAKRDYREGLTLSDAAIQRRYNEAVQESALRWANAQNAQARIERHLAAGPPTMEKPLPVPPGSRLLTGKQYGPAEGLIVPERFKRALDTYLAPPGATTPIAAAAQWLSRQYKQQAMFLAFPSLLHKAKYDTMLSIGVLTEAGVKANPLSIRRMMALAVREDKAWRTTGKMSKAVEALDQNTRALLDSHGSADLGELGSSLRNAVSEKPPNMHIENFRRLRNSVPKGIGNIERVHKIMLTEQLAPKYGYAEAARIAQETISGAHVSSPLYQVLDRYGGVPFLSARARSFPRFMKMAITNPGAMRLASGIPLAQAMGAAMPPDVQARQRMLGPDAIPIPGWVDQEGRQRFLSKNPLAVSPSADVLSLGTGVLGPVGALLDAWRNVDMTHTTQAGQAEPINRPGEMPPIDADWERTMYVLERGAPAIARSAERVAMAAQGRTRFGGPYAEPESISDALIGIATGARLGTAETTAEKQARAQRQAQSGTGQRALQAVLGYYGKLSSGQTAVPDGMAAQAERYTDLGKAKGIMLLAKQRLKSIATGRQYSPAAQTGALEHQTAWIYVLIQHFTNLAAQQQALEAASRVPR